MPHCRGYGRRRGGRRRGKRSHQHQQQPPLASVDATSASRVGTSGPTATYFQLIISPASPRPHSPLPLPRAQSTNNEVSHQLNDHHDAPLFQFIHDNRENGQRESTGPFFRRIITSANASKPAAPSSSSSCSSVPSYAVMASSSSSFSSHEAKSPIVFSVKVTPADGRCLVEPRSPALFRFVDSTSSYGDSSPDVSPSLAKNSALRCDVSPSVAAPNANENEKSTTTLAAKPHSNGPATSPHSRLQKPLHIQITPPTPQLPHSGILRDSDKGALFQFVSSTRNEGEGGKGTPSDSVNGDVTIRLLAPHGSSRAGATASLPVGAVFRAVHESDADHPRSSKEGSVGEISEVMSPRLFQFLGNSSPDQQLAIQVEPVTPGAERHFKQQQSQGVELFQFLGDSYFPTPNGAGLSIKVEKEQTPAVSPRHVPTPSDFFRFLEEPIATETNGGGLSIKVEPAADALSKEEPRSPTLFAFSDAHTQDESEATDVTMLSQKLRAALRGEPVDAAATLPQLPHSRSRSRHNLHSATDSERNPAHGVVFSSAYSAGEDGRAKPEATLPMMNPTSTRRTRSASQGSEGMRGLRVLMERLSEQEEAYVSLLNVLSEEYVNPLTSARKALQLSHKQIQCIFDKVQTIVSFHRTFLDACGSTVSPNLPLLPALAASPLVSPAPRNERALSASMVSITSDPEQDLVLVDSPLSSHTPNLSSAMPAAASVFRNVLPTLLQLYEAYFHSFDTLREELQALYENQVWQESMLQTLYGSRCKGLLSLPVLLFVPLQRVRYYLSVVKDPAMISIDENLVSSLEALASRISAKNTEFAAWTRLMDAQYRLYSIRHLVWPSATAFHPKRRVLLDAIVRCQEDPAAAPVEWCAYLFNDALVFTSLPPVHIFRGRFHLAETRIAESADKIVVSSSSSSVTLLLQGKHREQWLQELRSALALARKASELSSRFAAQRSQRQPVRQNAVAI